MFTYLHPLTALCVDSETNALGLVLFEIFSDSKT